eukprot:TRINITY_DN43132_c0_g1_i1.p1 TRINITY_DN43132_c0_g1~~TRINITY_DN43132_c0_g1_i1.p1  ORF type:complete len:609 (+),score=100.94 TRINITY_DN43132_c0_g1_i1:57-1883(+)
MPPSPASTRRPQSGAQTRTRSPYEGPRALPASRGRSRTPTPHNSPRSVSPRRAQVPEPSSSALRSRTSETRGQSPLTGASHEFVAPRYDKYNYTVRRQAPPPPSSRPRQRYRSPGATISPPVQPVQSVERQARPADVVPEAAPLAAPAPVAPAPAAPVETAQVAAPAKAPEPASAAQKAESGSPRRGAAARLARTRMLVVNRQSTQQLGAQYRTSRRGVVITWVLPGSPAANAGFAPGQELISVGGGRVTTAAEAEAAFAAAPVVEQGTRQCVVVVAGPLGRQGVAVRSASGSPPRRASPSPMHSSPERKPDVARAEAAPAAVPEQPPPAASDLPPPVADPPPPETLPAAVPAPARDPTGPRGSSRTLSQLPDPQAPPKRRYSSSNYTSKRSHPRGFGYGRTVRSGYGAPVQKRMYPLNMRTQTGGATGKQRKEETAAKAPTPPPSAAWSRLARDAVSVGIEEDDLGLLFWSTVEGLCVHFNITEPAELAEVQSAWRARHKGGDDPHPIVPPQPVPLPPDVHVPDAVPFVPPVVLPPPPPPVLPVPALLPYPESPRRWQSPPPQAASSLRRQDPRGPPGKLDWYARPRVDTGLRAGSTSDPHTAPITA